MKIKNFLVKYRLSAISILLAWGLFPQTNVAQTLRAVVAPLSVVGEVTVPEQQMIFNRFRERLNRYYQLVSHKMVEGISKHGYSSVDIEDCSSAHCVRTVLAFLGNLQRQFEAQDLFLLQIVRAENETQLSLKQVALSSPEVTDRIITESCTDCKAESLTFQLGKIVERIFADSSERQQQPELPELPELKTAEQEISDSLEEEGVTEIPEEELEPEEAIFEEVIPEDPPAPDPYLAARNAYNQRVGQFLVDVTYALQIFRSGMFVQLEVSIDESGKVVEQKIVQTSGDDGFDETAISTLEAVQFDPLPEVMRKYGNYVVILQIQNSR